ncbi:flagellar basal body-associated protein FliL [Desulfovibrio sp. X2]|uniref:flagellar basal body-associated FliL family protein n=1 Tax=Desulfovibrio sp. X2 TaxID=941449 RepID=UPI0003587CB7|nr:flagellar basal body-associated FliL family protein [Desulfovibrio sp. X2]EPR42436.1 flagellar basal body-associated protein FliL [Desulfovibrio sp. X2]
MVLMVPGDDDPLGVDEPEGGKAGEEKAKLDESDLDPGQEVPRALQKVELDLDDAPFLEDEDEEEPAAAAAEEAPKEIGLEEKKPRSAPSWLKNKKLLFLLAALLLVGVGATLFLLLRSPSKAPAPPPPPPVEEHAEKPAEHTPPPPPPKPTEFTVSFEPFWVEKIDADKRVHFLHISFAVTTKSEQTEREINAKMLILRDAVYYYLKNKDYAFLADTGNLEAIKADILQIVNKFLGTDQLSILLIKKYLVQ